MAAIAVIGTILHMDAIDDAWHGRDVDLQTETQDTLAAMRGCPQTPAFHAEGDVAVHTAWAYDIAREHAAAYVHDGGCPVQAAALRVAALLHDVGKPETTIQVADDVYSAKGHENAGAYLLSHLAQTHPTLTALPLGVYASMHALVRDHMWTYAAGTISRGAALRMTHLTDPRLLMALWDADARGRVCRDTQDVADRVAYAALILEDLGTARPDAYGLLEVADPRRGSHPRAWRETFRAHVNGELTDVGAVSARLAAADRHSTGGSLTYTIGLPGLGKSTWARQVWQPATDGVVLSSEGARRRDRRAATAAVMAEIPRLLAAGANVSVDATHLVRETRDVLVTFAGRYGASLHAVYFHAPLQLSLTRQRNRRSGDAVPATTIATMARKLRWPTPDEYQTLTIIEPSGGMWDYTPTTRWMTGTDAQHQAAVTAATWAERVAEAKTR